MIMVETPTVTQLTQVITQVTRLRSCSGCCGIHLGADARMNRMIDRSQALNAVGDDEAHRAYLRTDIPRLKRRAVLLNKAILFSTISAITTSVLVIGRS
jgi:Protein of unknown function (DUF2721)